MLREVCWCGKCMNRARCPSVLTLHHHCWRICLVRPLQKCTQSVAKFTDSMRRDSENKKNFLTFGTPYWWLRLEAGPGRGDRMGIFKPLMSLLERASRSNGGLGLLAALSKSKSSSIARLLISTSASAEGISPLRPSANLSSTVLRPPLHATGNASSVMDRSPANSPDWEELEESLRLSLVDVSDEESGGELSGEWESAGFMAFGRRLSSNAWLGEFDRASSGNISPGELNAVLYAELKKSVSLSSIVPARVGSSGSGELKLGRNRRKGSSLTAMVWT